MTVPSSLLATLLVKQRMYEVGMVNTQGWQFETCHELRLCTKYEKTFNFYYVAVICTSTEGTDQIADYVTYAIIINPPEEARNDAHIQAYVCGCINA